MIVTLVVATHGFTLPYILTPALNYYAADDAHLTAVLVPLLTDRLPFSLHASIAYVGHIRLTALVAPHRTIAALVGLYVHACLLFLRLRYAYPYPYPLPFLPVVFPFILPLSVTLILVPAPSPSRAFYYTLARALLVVRVILIGEPFLYRREFFFPNFRHFFRAIFQSSIFSCFFFPQKYWNVNELDIFAFLENFTNSDRTPPYIDTYVQLFPNFGNFGKNALR